MRRIMGSSVKRWIVAAAGVALLAGCGFWVWTGHYTAEVGGPYGARIVMDLAQPNPFVVDVTGTMAISNGHDVCQLDISGCSGSVNVGTDSWHAAACNLSLLQPCFPASPPLVIVSDIDGVLATQTGGQIDSFTVTFSDLGGGGPQTFPVPMVRTP